MDLVFVVDDDLSVQGLVRRWLESAGYRVACLPDGEACLDLLSSEMPSAVCLDLNMPGMDGMEALQQIKQRSPVLPVLMLTADESVDRVVQAMRLGAYDYLTKPLNQTKLLTTLKNAIAHHELSLRVTHLQREAEGGGYAGVVGESKAMRAIFRQLDRLATSDVTVLIHGESGTGKEVIARAIHESSGRKNGPFVAVNSAAIPESLLESELFGHEKGAFTGAVARRIGRFEEANGGTLFLDEIGELAPPVQAKLLRVLQERRFHRLGSSTVLNSDFRLLSATHRNLSDDVESGRFRQDLFFRIAVFELELPALRDRREDILPLARVFLNQAQGGHPVVTEIDDDAAGALLNYSWPGNVRELQNVIQRSIVLAEGTAVELNHLPERLRSSVSLAMAAPAGGAYHNSVAVYPSPGPLRVPVPVGAPLSAETGRSLEDASKQLLVRALQRSGGNVSAAMRELKVSRTRLYRMLKRYGLEESVESMRRSGRAEQDD